VVVRRRCPGLKHNTEAADVLLQSLSFLAEGQQMSFNKDKGQLMGKASRCPFRKLKDNSE
jgi:hypothetical protein